MAEYLNGYFSLMFTREDISSLPVPNAKFQEVKSEYLGQLIVTLVGGCRRTSSRFNKTRFAIQAKGPDGKWTRKPLAYRESNNVHLLITRPPEICVNLVFKHTHAASSYTICRQFVPFIYCPL